MTTTKNELEESLPKSTRERILRKLRPKIKSPKKARKEPHMKGRVMPKKQGDNDPRRNNPWVDEAFEQFNALDEGDIKYGDLDKEVNIALLEFVNHMIAVSMGGWSESEFDEGTTVYKNDSGRIADPENWDLNEDSTLSLKDGSKPGFDTEWLHKHRSGLSNVKHG